MVTLTPNHNSGDTFSIGNTTVTYTAVDPDSNTMTDSFVITIEGEYFTGDLKDSIVSCTFNAFNMTSYPIRSVKSSDMD